MRVCILSVVSQRHMVMSSMYTNYFLKKGIEFDLIYLDKYQEKEESVAKNTYRYEVENRSNLFGKIINYYSFKNFAKRKIKQNKYDYIIVWNEVTSVLFGFFLSKSFSNKYVLNIRDLFNEKDKIKNAKVLNFLLFRTIANAKLTTVPTVKFLDYLPKEKNYAIVHSINKQIMPSHKNTEDNGKPLNILYIGNIIYEKQIQKFIEIFKNDKRYVMSFVGVGSHMAEEYANKVGCNNIRIVGRFKSEDTLKYLNTADIIFNLYGNDFINERTALSNKLYYAVCLNVPILVNEKTYMEDISKECGIGYVINLSGSKSQKDELFKWYKELNHVDVHIKCNDFINKALESHDELEKRLDTILI